MCVLYSAVGTLHPSVLHVAQASGPAVGYTDLHLISVGWELWLQLRLETGATARDLRLSRDYE